MDYESGISVRWARWGWVGAWMLAAATSLACSGDDSSPAAACNFDADCGAGFSCQDKVCVANGSDTGGDGSDDDDGQSSEDGDSDTAGSDAADSEGSGGGTGSATTGPPDTSTCDPDARLFDGDPLQASISIDEAAMTCAAHSLASTDPQFVLDIRPTGLADVTATGGLTIQSSSQGTYVNDTSVVGITTELLVTMTGTAPGGTPLELQFMIDEVGPQITMVRVEWNPT